MLKAISCRNFRCFREETVFPLAPLTVLVGPNNAGKSTVIDLMRLLSQGKDDSGGSADGHSHHDEPFRLNFRSGDHRLSSFDQLLSPNSNILEVGLRFEGPNPSSSSIRLTDLVSIHREYCRDDGSARLRRQEGYFSEPLEIGTESRNKRKKIFSIDYEREKMVTPPGPSGEVPYLRSGYWELGYDWENESPRVKHVEETMEYVDVGEGIPLQNTDAMSCKFILYPTTIKMGIAYFNKLHKNPVSVDVHPIESSEFMFSSRAPKSFGPTSISLLEAPESWPTDLREELWSWLKDKVLLPVSTAINRASQLSVTYAPSYRASARAYYGPSDPFTDLLRAFDTAGQNKQNSVNRWIEDFNLGHDFQVERKGPSLYEASLVRHGERRSLADVGSGVSQLLPLILQLPQASWRDILLVEEPEANLHPDLQARLADLFGHLAQRRQIIVETHSEYFIRRIQYLVARGEIEPELVQVLYIEPPEETASSQVRPISIDHDGQLSAPFGSGFFDQATELMVDLFKYGSEN